MPFHAIPDLQRSQWVLGTHSAVPAARRSAAGDRGHSVRRGHLRGLWSMWMDEGQLGFAKVLFAENK